MDARRDTTRSGARGRGALGVLALAGAVLLGGCLHDPTEIVVVVDSDLKPFVDFDVIQFVIFGNSGGANAIAEGTVLPATLGLIPQDFGAKQFDVMAVATQGFDQFGGGRKAIVSRRVSNIRFVPDEMRAVFISLLRQCMCRGTNCDTNPPCNDIVTPTLTAFDEDNIPHLPAAP